jgi:DNA-binding transcriptional ArsR family regulator
MAEHREITDPRTLKALAHPLRVQLLDALREAGPATATSLAERLGESSGSTSYHLRQLAKHGFIEEDDERSGGRERWWRVSPQRVHIHGFDLMSRPETRADATTLLSEIVRQREGRVRRWFAEGASWGKAWQEATIDTEARIVLSRAELAELSEELMAVVTRYIEMGDRPQAPEGAAVVDVQVFAFPLRTVGDD